MSEIEETISKIDGADSRLSEETKDIRIVYFSSSTEGTKKFVDKVGYPAERLPLYRQEEFLHVNYDYVLVVPTYGGGHNTQAVPKQVIKFLNDETNRSHCRGVIAAGNMNFGEHYCLAGEIISKKLGVPRLYNFEIMGMPHDVERVQEGLKKFWGSWNNQSEVQ